MAIDPNMIGKHVLVDGKRTGRIETRPTLDLMGMPVGPGAIGTWAALPGGQFVIIPVGFNDWPRLDALRASLAPVEAQVIKPKAPKNGD
jgi:hypothetical protein